MSQENAQTDVPFSASEDEETREEQLSDATLQTILASIRNIQEDASQISELSVEQNRLLSEFFSALLKVTSPLIKTIPVSANVLKQDFGDVNRASLDCSGLLLILRKDGSIESVDLTQERCLDSLGKIVNDVLPKIEKLVAAYRERVEKRLNLLTSVTKELQEAAKAIVDIADNDDQKKME